MAKGAWVSMAKKNCSDCGKIIEVVLYRPSIADIGASISYVCDNCSSKIDKRNKEILSKPVKKKYWDCSQCKGSGRFKGHPCAECNGSGKSSYEIT